jgi:hypothetical protein
MKPSKLQSAGVEGGLQMTIKQAGVMLSQVGQPFQGCSWDVLNLMKVSAVAQMIGLHPRTIYQRVHRGEIPAWGKPLRVRLEDVLKPFVPRAATDGGNEQDQIQT